MRNHRTILKQLLAAKELTLPAIAAGMGWKSPRTVAFKLSGQHDWKTGELQRMCEIAGITIIRLAELSDDLVLTKHPESVTAARLIDSMTASQREQVIQYILSIETPKRD